MFDHSSACCANGHTPSPDKRLSNFCVICGAAMMVTCPNGHQVRLGRFCSICGVRLSVLDAQASSMPSGSRVATAPDNHERDEPLPAPSHADHENTAAFEPASAHDRSHRSRLMIFGVVFLMLLLAGGAYFGVSALTRAGPSKPAAAGGPPTYSSSPAPSIAQPTLPPSAAPPTQLSPTAAQPFAPPTTTADPGQVVTAYFAAINSGHYAQAWALGGKNIENGTYDEFVRGFATTAADVLTVVSVVNDTVAVHIDATHLDGTHQYFVGTYTVRDGEIVEASVRRTGG